MAYKSPEDAKTYHRELYRWCVAHGVCAYCRTAYAEPGRVYCTRCAQRNRALLERRDPGRERRKSYNRQWKQKKMAEGLCVNCGTRPAEEGHTRCPACARKNRESDLVRRIRQRIEREAKKGG